MNYELYNHTTLRPFKGGELIIRTLKGDELIIRPFKGGELMLRPFKGDEFVEAMTSKIILMMSKNQEVSKFQRIRLQESSLKESRLMNNQDQDSREVDFKIQEKKSRSNSQDFTREVFFQKIQI